MSMFRRTSIMAIAAVMLVAGVGCSQPVELTGPDLLRQMAVDSLSQVDGELQLPGLQDEVEVLRDQWGVAHIYAKNTDDLFFTQGFVAAQDRLWQLDMWRRYAEGRSSELEGPDRFRTDVLYRLIKFREQESEAEWTSYHPEGKRILTAFANGINAFIDQAGDNLPVEFKLTGITPERWTPSTSALRLIQRSVGGARQELQLAQQVAKLGAEEANRQADPDPWYELTVPTGLDVTAITDEVVAAFQGQFDQLLHPEVLPEYRVALGEFRETSRRRAERIMAGLFMPPPMAMGIDRPLPAEFVEEIGSNNWVVSGELTDTGMPILANDPHRQVTNPSLRYIVHLNAPGWNVIGSGEPSLPGVAIGHNERVAWGLTIVGTDHDDLYVEQVNPENPNEVRWQDSWEPLRVITEQINVKGEGPREVELKFSRHGPIIYEDTERHLAYALRTTTLEPGTAHYLGSLRVDQVETCGQFLDAMDYWKQPSENMICADVDGSIAWQASALTPKRDGWHGRLPVPGTGGYEWDGFRDDLPEEYNPERGWIATANHNIHPPGYDPPLMFKREPYLRYERLVEVIGAGGPFSLSDFERLQFDAYSSAAADVQPLFEGWSAEDEAVERARALVAGWDNVFSVDSDAAAIYFTWRRLLDERALDAGVAEAERADLVESALADAVAELTQSLGADWSEWRWGRLNQSAFPHSLTPVFDLPTVERGGGAGTVGATGATYREIFDLADWDRSVVTNAPGQSGQPESPHYGDLLDGWVNGDYFPLVFSREAVEEATANRLLLTPAP